MKLLNNFKVPHTSLNEDVLGDYVAIYWYIIILGAKENLDIFKLKNAIMWLYVFVFICRGMI